MKTIFNITGAVALTALATTANAASFSLAGAPASVNVGDSFNVQVIGDLPGDSLLGGGSIFGFDPALVSIDNITVDVVGSDPFFTCPTNCHGLNATGQQLGYGSFGGLALNNTVMNTITLTALAPGAAELTLSEDPFNGNTSGFTFGPISGFTYSGATVVIEGGTPPPIPVPAAVWLFGSGLLGLVGVARRKA